MEKKMKLSVKCVHILTSHRIDPEPAMNITEMLRIWNNLGYLDYNDDSYLVYASRAIKKVMKKFDRGMNRVNAMINNLETLYEEDDMTVISCIMKYALSNKRIGKTIPRVKVIDPYI